MKNISPISSVTTKTEVSPKYSLNEEGFEKQLQDAISAAGQLEMNKHKQGNEKLQSMKASHDQNQISFNQMNATAPTKTYTSASSLNAYKAQKSAVRSKMSFDL